MSLFQTDLKSADVVSFLKNRHKDLLSEKSTDIVTVEIKSGSRTLGPICGPRVEILSCPLLILNSTLFLKRIWVKRVYKRVLIHAV
jgi:hypothetical protein